MTYRIAGHRVILPALAAVALAAVLPLAIGHAQTSNGQTEHTTTGATPTGGAACDNDTGITLPPGFCATVFADKLGHPRQMVVAPDGVLYVNTWSGRYYQNDTPPPGGFLIALKDTHDDGHADVVQRFGETPATGGHGGTGIAIYKDGLYAEINDRIVRYPLINGEVAPQGQPTTVVSGLPLTGDHPDASDDHRRRGPSVCRHGLCDECLPACEPHPAFAWHPALHRVGDPGRHLALRRQQDEPAFFAGGALCDRAAQRRRPVVRRAGRLIATQHGRDQLFENWPNLYTQDQGKNLPAEQLVVEHQGDDFGWPECYFDGYQQKLVLAPEYGGDGKKVGVCAQKQAPVAFFPGHWAPNDMMIYDGTQFPHGYRGGAFIAFHGSWNRAPAPQGGYNVVFQPLADGKASGHWVVFADGFAGAHKDPGGAAHRPTGLAVAPDGSLYISDDKGGRIWHVTYSGSPDARRGSACPGVQAETRSPRRPAAGRHPSQRWQRTRRPPAAARRDAGAACAGRADLQGRLDNATCAGCHGMDGKGTAMGADLTSGNTCGGMAACSPSITSIMTGVPHPKAHSGVMPPYGGVTLSQADTADVAAYVWSLSHHRQASATK